MSSLEPPIADDEGAPSATRHNLQLGRRLFHLANGVGVATAYALFFTHEQLVHVFGAIACIVYILDRIRIAYPDVIARRAPWLNRTFLRAEEQVREAAMTPFAIAVLLTILAVPKLAALVAIYTLGIADPLAAIIGIRFGRRRITHNRTFEGSAAFFLATAAVVAGVLYTGTMTEPATIAIVSAAVAFAAAMFELLPLRIDDNLTIPLFVGFSSWIVFVLAGVRIAG